MTSFPFLKIARDYGVSYGHVIRHAEWIEAADIRNKPSFRPFSPICCAVAEALGAEIIRRKANSAPSYEQAGTAYDSGAVGHERLGRASAPARRDALWGRP